MTAELSLNQQPGTPNHLLKRYLGLDPYQEGPENAVIRGSRLHVYALVADLNGNDFDVGRTAQDYEIAPRFVGAALTYYQRYQEVIDRRLEEMV